MTKDKIKEDNPLLGEICIVTVESGQHIYIYSSAWVFKVFFGLKLQVHLFIVLKWEF